MPPATVAWRTHSAVSTLSNVSGVAVFSVASTRCSVSSSAIRIIA